MVAVRYPIRAVSRLTGVSLDTLRVWERRYKVVTPERSGRGRVYCDAEIDRLLLLRDAIDRGHAIGQVAPLSDDQLRELGQHSTDVAKAFPAKDENNGGGLDPLILAIEGFDAAGANDEIGRLAALMPATDLITSVALPLMRTVGERSHRRTFSIAHVHMASAVLRNLFGSLLRLYKPREPAVRLVFATPSGEHHEFGILAAAMLAARLGLEPIYLGANLPAQAIAAAAERSGSRVIVIGMVDKSPESASLRELGELESAVPASIEIWVGGRALTDQSRAVQDRISTIDTFEALERQLRRLRQPG